MEIQCKDKVLAYYGLPAIPAEKHKWDGKTSFTQGVGIIRLSSERLAYAPCTYDSEHDVRPRVIKAFLQEPFTLTDEIYVVPTFMNTNVDDMDLDEASKRAAERLAQEGDEIIAAHEDNAIREEIKALPEWVFDNIHNIDEARAFVQSWHSTNKIKGKIPQNEETLKLRLLAIRSEIDKKSKNDKK